MKTTIKYIKLTATILTALSIALGFATGFISAFRIVFGSVFVLFLPGFIISFILFPTKKISQLERIALSFALSISIVPMAVFYINLLGLPMSSQNVTFITLGIILISAAILKWKK